MKSKVIASSNYRFQLLRKKLQLHGTFESFNQMEKFNKANFGIFFFWGELC